MSRAAKFAVALLGGTAVIVAGYELDLMPVAGAGVVILVVGVWWAKLSR